MNPADKRSWQATFDHLARADTSLAQKAGYEPKLFPRREAVIVELLDRLATHRARRRITSFQCLDVGSNVGHFTAKAAERGFEMHGVDFSEEALAEARRNYPQLSFVSGSALALPFPDGTFDGVMSFGVIQLLPDWRRGLAEILRALKPGGMALLETNRRQPLPLNLARQASYVIRGQLSARAAIRSLRRTSGLDNDSAYDRTQALYFTPRELETSLHALGATRIRRVAPSGWYGLLPDFVFGIAFESPESTRSS